MNLTTMKVSISAITLATLVACGGGSSASGVANTMSGAVMDGLIENAKVCLDLNNNLQCDAGEPSAVTDKNGNYSISYIGSLDGLHVIAEVTAESKDADDNGQTLKQAGKEAFNLASPASRPEVVTPLTTLVTHAIIADPTLKTDADSLKKAEDTVKANTNLKADLLGYNYVDKKDTSVHDIAKVISVALGDINKEMKATLETKKASDSELATALTTAAGQKSIQANVVKAVTNMVASAIGSEGKLTKTLADVIAQNKAEVGNVVSGQINNIIVATKLGDAKVADAAAIFKRGLIIGNNESSYLKDGTKFEDNLQIEYIKVDKDAMSIYSAQRILYVTSSSKPSWQEKKVWGKNFVLTKDNKWLYDPDLNEGKGSNNGDIVFDKNCVTLKTDVDKVTANDSVCLTEKDLSGKKIKSFINDFCDADQKKSFPSCNADAVFKAGSYAYDMTFGVTEDKYTNEVSADWDGYTTVNNAKTVSTFIEHTKTGPQWTGHDCNTGFKVKSYDASTKKGVMQWGDYSKYTCNNAYQQTFTSIEETNFEVKMVGDIEMLILDISTTYNKNNQNDGVGRKFIFNYMSDTELGRSGIYKGELQFKSTKRQFSFNGDVKLGSPELLDSFLEALGMSAFPYPTTPTFTKK